jgi:hypothetical protein
MTQSKIRARYKVVGPKTVTRIVTKAYIDPVSKAMNTKRTEVTEPMWTVFFPQGHSTRMNEKELRYHNLHRKPRLQDLATGDIIDMGGDEYDLDKAIEDFDAVLEHDDDDLLPSNDETENSASKSKQKG